MESDILKSLAIASRVAQANNGKRRASLNN